MSIIPWSIVDIIELISNESKFPTSQRHTHNENEKWAYCSGAAAQIGPKSSRQ